MDGCNPMVSTDGRFGLPRPPSLLHPPSRKLLLAKRSEMGGVFNEISPFFYCSPTYSRARHEPSEQAEARDIPDPALQPWVSS